MKGESSRSARALIEETLEHVPRYRVFLTPDQLDRSTRRMAHDHPETVRVEVAGRTTGGAEILAQEIGEGDRTALLIGAPHPNEPIGTLTADLFARQWAENPELRRALGFRLVIVKSIDRDGLVLNEGWIQKPITPMSYALGYYRPPARCRRSGPFPSSTGDTGSTGPSPRPWP